MPRISRPATHTGDDGTTATIHGKRVAKDADLIRAFGTLDELNAVIGVVLSLQALSPELIEPLRAVQNDLFHLGADLDRIEPTTHGVPTQPRIETRHIRQLDELIAKIYDELGPLKNFTLPGGSPSAATLHLARTVCRRAERAVVGLASLEQFDPEVVVYLNRLSDLLFVLARLENAHAGRGDIPWEHG